MKFYVSTAFRETKEAIEIAKAADDPGIAASVYRITSLI
jgi:hypothetical protein